MCCWVASYQSEKVSKSLNSIIIIITRCFNRTKVGLLKVHSADQQIRWNRASYCWSGMVWFLSLRSSQTLRYWLFWIMPSCLVDRPEYLRPIDDTHINISRWEITRPRHYCRYRSMACGWVICASCLWRWRGSENCCTSENLSAGWCG